MTCNVGNTDRIIRGVLGLALIGAGVYFSIWLAVVGAILVGTAAVKFCPIYWSIKMSTAEKK